MECGLPVPSELLEESGLPPRNIDSGAQNDTPKMPAAAAPPEPSAVPGDLKPQLQGGEQNAGTELKPHLQGGEGENSGADLKPQLTSVGEEAAGAALKPKFVGGEQDAGSGQAVHASMQESSSATSDSSSEKLVFCPNCGMRMQHDPQKCEKCGMALGNKPNNPQTASNGIPLFNTDSDPFGLNSFNNFSNGIGGIDGISEEEAASIDNFVNGALDPMFNSGGSEFNVQATPSDFAQLTEQLANFSAGASMPTIEAAENTLIRQKEPEKGEEREVEDFAMIDDLSCETVPLFENGVPVIGDYSMEDDPNADDSYNPYAFLNTSMDEDLPITEEKPVEATPVTAVPVAPQAVEPVAPQAVEPVVPQAVEPVALQAVEPVAPQAVEPVAPQAVEPVAPQAVGSVAPQAVEPVALQAVEPVALQAVEPVAPQAVEPVALQAVEPVAPQAIEPVAPQAVKPVAPQAVEPVAPQSVEPVAPQAVEPVAPPHNPFNYDDFVPEEAPFIAETAPVVTEFTPNTPPKPQDSNKKVAPFKSDEKPDLPEPLNITSAPRNPQPNSAASGAAQPGNPAPRVPQPNGAAPRAAQSGNADPRNPQPNGAAPRRPAPSSMPSTKRCPLCSRIINGDDGFCPQCGRSMNGEANPHVNEIPHNTAVKFDINRIPVIILALVVIVVFIMVIVSLNSHAAEICENDLVQCVSECEYALSEQTESLSAMS